jgi:hypothetical protein
LFGEWVTLGITRPKDARDEDRKIAAAALVDADVGRGIMARRLFN